MVQAWLICDSVEDKKAYNHRTPPEYLNPDDLKELGLLYWKIPVNDTVAIDKIKTERGYNYEDILDASPDKLENYDAKLKAFFQEHMHPEEEIRYTLAGSGFFDVRNKQDKWVRIMISPGDLLILPAGIYHRFTLDENNYVKLRRFFGVKPVWSCFNRPADDHPSRKEYLSTVNNTV